MFEQFHCARVIPRLPADLKAVLDEAHRNGTEPVLSDEQDEMFTNAAGVAPGLVEIFASAEARDAALGLCAPYAEVVAVSPAELVNAEMAMSDVAVGHRVGEVGFEPVLDAKADASASAFAASTEPTMEVVVDRITYTIDRTGRVIAMSPVYGRLPSDAEIRATRAWLHRVYGPRLNPDKADSGEKSDD